MKKISINIIGKVPPPIGGVTIHTLRLFQWLKKDSNFDVTLTALNKHSLEDENIQYSGNFALWIIKKLFFGFKEDIVHYQGANYYGLVILAIVRKLHPSFKLLWSIHSEYLIDKIKNKKLFNFAIKNIDNIIAVNINIKNQLMDNNFLDKNIVIISPFLMPDNFNKKENTLLNKFKNNDKIIILFNAYRLVFNSNDKDVYGLDTLIKSFVDIKKNTILILLIPFMDNNEKKYYNKLLEILTIEQKKRVILISDTIVDGWKYINSCDIFVRPTITDGDALSIKEALYMNKPTIVSDCTVRPDNTILFKTSCPDDLSEKINETIDNKYNITNLTKENNINKFINFYKAIRGKNANTIS